jgi:carboxyl-terminal processing protease
VANQRRFPWWLTSTVAVIWTALLLAPVAAYPDAKLDDLRREAEQAEQAGHWDKACSLYDQLITTYRNRPEFREHFRICLRHANIVHRHQDPTYRDEVLSRDIRTAYRIYREVLAKLRANYVDPDKVDLTRLFQNGLEELQLALDEDVFRQSRLPPGLKPEAIEAFQKTLRRKFGQQPIRNQRELEAEVGKVAQSARQSLQLEPVVTVLEFACGACDGLDEHTLFLTPRQFTDVYASLEGEIVGIGIDIAMRDHKVIITQVLMGSPAAMEGLKPEDRVTRIDKKPLDNLPEELVAERLRGAPGTMVELEVVAVGEMLPRSFLLTRQVMHVPSVVQAQILPEHEGIGYCRVASFQKSTVQELDEALMQLKMQGMKVLILDLRSNWGGIFSAAIQAAERFLPEGKVIASTQSPVPDQVQIHRASYAGTVDIPLVLLIDGETASAAEVVAGALKDHGRAVLVGQPTFGKCSIQRVLQLEASRGGIRVTLARFLSPGGTSYNIRGVMPDILEERVAMSMSDSQLLAAIRVAITKLGLPR